MTDPRYGPAYFGAPGDGAISNHSDDPYGYLSSPFERHAFIVAKWMEVRQLSGPVLEVGCARGFLLRSLMALGVDAQGIDASEWAVEHASPMIAGRVQTGDVIDLPYEDHSFGMVVSFDVMEHLAVDLALKALWEIARVAPFQFHQVNTGRLPEFRFDSDETHVTKLSLAEWAALALDIGLDSTRVVFAEPAQRIDELNLGPWPIWLPEAPEITE